MGQSFVSPTPSAMGYDLIKTLRVWEWFERKKLSNWKGFQFCEDGFPKNPERRIILISRSFGWDLAKELKARFGILLNLRPGRDETRKGQPKTSAIHHVEGIVKIAPEKIRE